ncbi:MAG: hypothetical protein US18_C0017G0022 [Parcubacteria group bacterium GW2011_GWB1_36_5]|nr:MAG: hypothetical protein US18_C0017G0022 [Parcubacteria group bacterium GW2011_GWB1_36_5]
MKKIIHHLRNQSEEVRRHILHTLTIALGIILVLLWVYSLGTNLTSPETQTKIDNDLRPFSALKDNLIGGYKSISEPQ